MGELVPIGEFSALCQLSVKMLRHYDEIGLLAPAHVDPVPVVEIAVPIEQPGGVTAP
ncbi:MAG TPA: MerR family DNA-binding transcriptional regulator [Acidimicrobiia bacterium]|nr:MerR family DNA-binding transcriptional regulator [Acidimicrobiia bacterium]